MITPRRGDNYSAAVWITSTHVHQGWHCIGHPGSWSKLFSQYSGVCSWDTATANRLPRLSVSCLPFLKNPSALLVKLVDFECEEKTFPCLTQTGESFSSHSTSTSFTNNNQGVCKDEKGTGKPYETQPGPTGESS